MTSLVAEFLVNPVIRQARRFSLSVPNNNNLNDNLNDNYNEAHHHHQQQPPVQSGRRGLQNQEIHDDATSETDKESFSLEDDDIEEIHSTATSSSSRTSIIQLGPHHGDVACHQGEYDDRQPDLAPSTTTSDNIPRNHDLNSPALPSRAEPSTHHFSAETHEMDRELISPSHVPSHGAHPSEDGHDVDHDILQDARPARSTRSPFLNEGAQKPKEIPEDDGMTSLRRRILDIQSQDIPPPEKARLMHRLFLEGYSKSKTISSPTEQPSIPISPSAVSSDNPAPWQRLAQGPLESFRHWQSARLEGAAQEEFDLTESDIRPTFAPPAQTPDSPEDAQAEGDETEHRPFGCEHYRRNVKLQCSTCNRWYTCRFCHDHVEDHELIRKDTKNMLCMFCGTAQRAGEVCISCGVTAARYYCDICKLWNDDPDKNVYHCSDCGICRVGRGIGKDFFHCKKCCACIAISKELDHRCIERVTDCDCPICGDYMFTSPKAVCFMKCGHSIHRSCLNEYMETSYKCPICNKSVTNMEFQFRNIDMSIESQPMPPEFEDTRAVILCNDCSAKTSVKYHWLGLKCAVCQSYNTAQLQILGANPEGASFFRPQPNTQLPEASAATSATNVTFAQDIPTGREVPRRRRHSSNVVVPVPNVAGQSDLGLLAPDRLSRSFSPMPNFGNGWNDAQMGAIEEEEREDILGFWSRFQRSIGSDEDRDDEDDAAESEDGSDWSTDDEDVEDEDEEEEDFKDFSLLGHR